MSQKRSAPLHIFLVQKLQCPAPKDYDLFMVQKRTNVADYLNDLDSSYGVKVKPTLAAFVSRFCKRGQSAPRAKTQTKRNARR